jgi:curli biogenesis system outer membrane secretion channel CsgG
MRKLIAFAVAAVFVASVIVSVPTAGGADGNLRYSINVEKFENKAGWHGRWNVGDGFGEIMTAALNASGRFIVLGETDMRKAAMAEQDLAASGRLAGGKKAPKMGRMTPAQLKVKGAITHVQNETSGKKGGFSFKGVSLGGSRGKAEINITMYLVDTETGQVKASTKVVGKSGKKGLSVGYHGSALGGLRGDLAGFEKDNVGKACENAVVQAVEFLIEQLEDVPWEGTIMMAKPDKIIVNRGTREGVSTGMRFNVGDIEELVDEDTGEVLDSEMTVVGELKVTNAKEKVAYCAATKGGPQIKKGMSVFPVE